MKVMVILGDSCTGRWASGFHSCLCHLLITFYLADLAEALLSLAADFDCGNSLEHLFLFKMCIFSGMQGELDLPSSLCAKT